MAKRFKDPVAPVPQHSGELPEVPLPEHPTLGEEPLSNAAVSEDAPHPIGVDPAVTGAFSTITAEDGTAPIPTIQAPGHGASPAARGRRAPASTPGGRHRGFSKVAIVIIAAIVVCFVAGAFFVLWNVAQSAPAEGSGEGQRVDQTQSAPGQPLYYDSYVYTLLRQDDGRWGLVRSSPTGAEQLDLFDLEGTPVELVLSDGVFVIPENLDGSWDVIAWVIGDGNVPTQLMGEDGAPITGQGQLVSASLSDEDELTLMAEDGAVDRIPLGFWD